MRLQTLNGYPHLHSSSFLLRKGNPVTSLDSGRKEEQTPIEDNGKIMALNFLSTEINLFLLNPYEFKGELILKG